MLFNCALTIYNRKLGFKHHHEIIKSKNGFEIPRFIIVAVTMAVDTKDRVWLLVYTEDCIDNWKNNHEKMAIEVYSPEGILLGKLKVPEKFKVHDNSKFRIYNDCIYFIDTPIEACILEYKIVDLPE